MNIKSVARDFLYPIPTSLRSQHTRGDAEQVKRAMGQHFHQGWRAKEKMSATIYQNELDAHLYQRLESDRRFIVPWLHAARSVDGLRILEIGCGTGASTVALAEQGAKVIGIDIDAPALEVAKERCQAHQVSAELQFANASQLTQFGEQDMIVYFAALEHMTNSERLTSLADAWSILPKGGLLVVIETPNRLWFYDAHTADLPFFHWLPDDLAFAYARFSPRDVVKDNFKEPTPEQTELFLRFGRGASYHEFELAIAPAHELDVVSSLLSHFGWRRTLRMPRTAKQYKKFLRQQRPDLHSGWFDQDLDIIIRKQ